ncbi:MAG: D-alanyl-D-alanine carboxypeptidase/D-alanyl-D-alanine-endopeptidase [Ignavibacteriae bacterium HGW-Ignavibacteriae-3]|nr:MAG: D-alanyl-D-alanine carboxypeptidase/D-alanyl-D-alanine-endopeptidase [Ignavibacteriae bacterium HGW-Ignavibacteriae-3]
MRLMANKFFLIILFAAPLIYSQQKDSLNEKKIVPNLNPLAELREQLDDYFNDPNFSGATWGVLVKSLKTGEVLYKRNADKLFSPASDMKLFTSSAALLLLGPEFSYETHLLINGDLDRGVLKGDLIIQGSGDPSLSNRFDEGYPTKIFEKWADTLKAKGIWIINGNIVGDDSAFDDIGYGRGWMWDYESEWFAAPSGALSYNDNNITVKIEPGEANFPAKVTLIPYTKFVTLIPKVGTLNESGETRISVKRLRGTNHIEVKGVVRSDSNPIQENVSITDPTMFFLTVLREVFERKGIVVRGNTINLNSYEKNIISDDLTPVYVHKSVPLKKIIKELNKNSNNFYAEQLLKTIGLEIYNFGSIENGVKASQELFNTMGINTENMVMADGSGLSLLDLVTPRQIVNLLSFMYKTDEFSKFYESLPIGGVDGTLINRMKKTSAENNVRAKAGYNNNVSSLSGYLKTLSGEQIAFSIIVNNYLAPSALANYIEDNVCNRLVNFTRN